MSKGLLSDEFMHDVVGLPYDLDDNGEVVKRESSYEAYQRAKSLTNDYQKSLRVQVIEKAIQKDRHDKLIQNQKKESIIQLNDEAYEILFGLLPRPHVQHQTLFHSTINNFNVLRVPHLKAFIHI